MMSEILMIPFYRQDRLPCLEGPFSWYNLKEKILIFPFLSCSLGHWFSSSLIPALLWTTTHFFAGYNSLINTVPHLRVCGGVEMGRFCICFCSLLSFSYTVPGFTEVSRQLQGITTKGKSLKFSKFNCPFSSRTGPYPRNLYPSWGAYPGYFPWYS